MRPRAGTLARNLPLLWDTGISKSLCLYLTPNGELHIYFDGKHIKKIESGLPVDVPLWGAVDVSGRCVQIKSQLLLKPLEGEAGGQLYYGKPRNLTCKKRFPQQLSWSQCVCLFSIILGTLHKM